MHSNGKLLHVQFEFIGACFPLADILVDHGALCESNVPFCVNEKDRVCPETAQRQKKHRTLSKELTFMAAYI